VGAAADLDPALPSGPVALAWFDLGRRSGSAGPADPVPTGTSSPVRSTVGAGATAPVEPGRPVVSSASARAAGSTGSAAVTSADTVTNGSTSGVPDGAVRRLNRDQPADRPTVDRPTVDRPAGDGPGVDRPAVSDRPRTGRPAASAIGAAAHRRSPRAAMPDRPGQEPASVEVPPATATPSPSAHIFFDVPTSKKMWAAPSDTALTAPEAGSTAPETPLPEQADRPSPERIEAGDPAARTDSPRAEPTHAVHHDAGTAAAPLDTDRAAGGEPWTSPITPAHLVPAARTPAATSRFMPRMDEPVGVRAADAPTAQAVTAPWPRLTGRERGQDQQPGPWPELLDDAELWAVPAPTRTDPDRIRVRQSQQEGRPWNA
jgi:hypothetical protein